MSRNVVRVHGYDSSGLRWHKKNRLTPTRRESMTAKKSELRTSSLLCLSHISGVYLVVIRSPTEITSRDRVLLRIKHDDSEGMRNQALSAYDREEIVICCGVKNERSSIAQLISRKVVMLISAIDPPFWLLVVIEADLPVRQRLII